MKKRYLLWSVFLIVLCVSTFSLFNKGCLKEVNCESNLNEKQLIKEFKLKRFETVIFSPKKQYFQIAKLKDSYYKKSTISLYNNEKQLIWKKEIDYISSIAVSDNGYTCVHRGETFWGAYEIIFIDRKGEVVKKYESGMKIENFVINKFSLPFASKFFKDKIPVQISTTNDKRLLFLFDYKGNYFFFSEIPEPSFKIEITEKTEKTIIMFSKIISIKSKSSYLILDNNGNKIIENKIIGFFGQDSFILSNEKEDKFIFISSTVTNTFFITKTNLYDTKIKSKRIFTEKELLDAKYIKDEIILLLYEKNKNIYIELRDDNLKKIGHTNIKEELSSYQINEEQDTIIINKKHYELNKMMND